MSPDSSLMLITSRVQNQPKKKCVPAQDMPTVSKKIKKSKRSVPFEGKENGALHLSKGSNNWELNQKISISNMGLSKAPWLSHPSPKWVILFVMPSFETSQFENQDLRHYRKKINIILLVLCLTINSFFRKRMSELKSPGNILNSLFLNPSSLVTPFHSAES